MTALLRVLPVAPLSRAECRDWPLRCALSSCRYHLGPDAIEACALTVAERGEHTFEEVAMFLGVSDSAVKQTEDRVLRKLARRLPWGRE